MYNEDLKNSLQFAFPFSVVARWQFKFLSGHQAELIKCGPSKTLAITFYRLTLGFTLSTGKVSMERRNSACEQDAGIGNSCTKMRKSFLSARFLLLFSPPPFHPPGVCVCVTAFYNRIN